MPGYIFEHDGKQYDPDGRVEVNDIVTHNEALREAEMAFWQTQPEEFGAYMVKRDNTLAIETWSGVPLGKILNASKFRNGLTGSNMTHVRMAGSNGATYHGRFGSDWSQFVRLRKCGA